jgi:hypothetical protein
VLSPFVVGLIDKHKARYTCGVGRLRPQRSTLPSRLDKQKLPAGLPGAVSDKKEESKLAVGKEPSKQQEGCSDSDSSDGSNIERRWRVAMWWTRSSEEKPHTLRCSSRRGASP